MKLFQKILSIFGAAALFATMSATSLMAQSVALADLQQDMAMVKRDLGNLKLEFEQLRRDNDALQARIEKIQNSSVQTDSVRMQVSSVKAQVSAQNEALKREIVALVRKDIEALASQTNTAIEKLAKAISVRPQATLTPANFGENYPKAGITYTVKSGDSISKIARQNNSRVKWIQDANKIADPARDLKVGDSIFIPQE